ncbi:MAG: FkbM family methyltransferase [Cyanobium sp.]
MPALGLLKALSIKTGLYQPTRWLSRKLRPNRWQAFHDDIALFRELIPDKELCFDVGANIGEKSEALLQAGMQVVAFEPNPNVLEELKARCQNHPNWSLLQTGLGSNSKIATLHIKKSHLACSMKEDWEGECNIASLPVPIVTLDTAIEFFGLPFFCKIDVEGWELEVIQGLNQPIPLISIEFHLNEYDINKTVSCLNFLENLGNNEINIMPAETSRLLQSKWLDTDEFLRLFPAQISRLMPDNAYGDILIRNKKIYNQRLGCGQ